MSQPEMEIHPDGTKYWYLNDKLHREDGPAIEFADGEKHWLLNDNLHREDGPAVEYRDGTKHWYLNDEEYSFEDYILELERLNLKHKIIDTLYNLV